MYAPLIGLPYLLIIGAIVFLIAILCQIDQIKSIMKGDDVIYSASFFLFFTCLEVMMFYPYYMLFK
jgi:hypothetical protein